MKIKNKIIATILAAMAIQPIAMAEDASVQMSCSDNKESFIISGTEAPESNLVLRVLYLGTDEETAKNAVLTLDKTQMSGSYLNYINTVETDLEGAFNVSYKSSMVSGFYAVTATNKETQTTLQDLYQYFSPTYTEEQTQHFNTLLSGEVTAVSDFLDKNLAPMEAGNKYIDEFKADGFFDLFVSKMISYGECENFAEFSDNVVCATVFIYLENYSDTQNVVEMLKFFETKIGILSESMKILSEILDEAAQSKVIADIKASTATNLDQLKANITSIVLLKGINYSQWGNVQLILEESTKTISAAVLSQYASLKSSYPSYYSDVAKNIAGTGINTVAELETRIAAEINAAIARARNAQSGGGSSSGGGGGGGSSSGRGNVVITGTPTTAPITYENKPGKFTDIESVEWAREAIEALADKGIINGTSETEFSPSRNITREEFLAILMRAFKIEAADAECSFEDVDENEWYAPVVAAAYSAGITNGISEKEFGIGRNITREDLCVLSDKVIKSKEIVLPQNDTEEFADVHTISNYAKESVEALQKAGVINGKAEKTFMPKDFATRAEAAKIIYSLLKLAEV